MLCEYCEAVMGVENPVAYSVCFSGTPERGSFVDHGVLNVCQGCFDRNMAAPGPDEVIHWIISVERVDDLPVQPVTCCGGRHCKRRQTCGVSA